MSTPNQLANLSPHWVGLGEASCKIIIGITFLSPQTGSRIGVLFKNPIDPQDWIAKIGNPMVHFQQNLWSRTGDTFETLTLSPSLDFSKFNDWHGTIQNGIVQ